MSWLVLTLNTLVTFALLLVLVRWIGSTQLTQLTYFNWVAGASMGNIAADMMAARSWRDWTSAGLTLVVFTAAAILAAYIALKSRSFRRVSTGEPVVLIHKGALVRENLRRTKVNLDVLMMLLREKGYFAYDEIEYGILEPTGNLSILPVQAAQSVSKRDLVEGPDLCPEGQGPYVEIVVDGEVDRDKLRSTGRDEAWLEQEIRKRGGSGLADVMYLAVNAQGQVIIDLHRRNSSEDGPPPGPSSRS
ncbi:MAG: DUF421 domain-containing protein [Alicyclobacillaceae bacterium]|nr:DUF421 domain-containing protein [Alicyclobacillaceae bacterium]